MQGKKSFLALSTAFAALFVGCEWTGTSESDSWSSAYDSMNFSGTYRAVTSATSLDTSTTDEVTDSSFVSVPGEIVSSKFKAGATSMSGNTQFGNLVPGSFQARTSSGYSWNDNGDGTLTFSSQNTSSDAQTSTYTQQDESIGTLNGDLQQYFNLKHYPVVKNSLTVYAGSIALTDNGNGQLTPTKGSTTVEGTITYDSGAISITFKGSTPSGDVKASYSYTKAGSTSVSGYGTILYSSGAWSLSLAGTFSTDQEIKLSYSYYIKNSTQTATYTTIYSADEVSALTVAQNGQNLSITLNNGIVMSGKFTNVQQTGKVNQDTNAGYNTYNAQFQVQTKDSKMVGSLNYDLKTGYRMLNGSWTWGKNTYDVQAVGPAWLNSADASTLSAGVQQSQK